MLLSNNPVLQALEGLDISAALCAISEGIERASNGHNRKPIGFDLPNGHFTIEQWEQAHDFYQSLEY